MASQRRTESPEDPNPAGPGVSLRKVRSEGAQPAGPPPQSHGVSLSKTVDAPTSGGSVGPVGAIPPPPVAATSVPPSPALDPSASDQPPLLPPPLQQSVCQSCGTGVPAGTRVCGVCTAGPGDDPASRADGSLIGGGGPSRTRLVAVAAGGLALLAAAGIFLNQFTGSSANTQPKPGSMASVSTANAGASKDVGETGFADPAEEDTAESEPAAEESRTAITGAARNPGCTGQFIVVYNLSTNLKNVDRNAQWARGAKSCSGIDSTIKGKAVVFNYLGPFSDPEDACDALLNKYPHQDYVKLLRADQSGGKHYLCSCDQSVADLPTLSESDGEYPEDPLEFRAVADLQLMLKRESGFESDNLGLYGPRTREAVADFQASNGMSPTGITDSDVWEALLESSTSCP